MSKEKYIPSLEEVKKAEEMMSDEQKEMSEEREATIKAGAEIERENLEEKAKFIDEKISRFEFVNSDVYMGIEIESGLEGKKIGTEAHAFVDKGELKIRLRNSRTNKITIFPIKDVHSINGLFLDEDRNTKFKVLWGQMNKK